MPSDTTTFFLSFAAVFAGLAFYIAHLENAIRRLQQRVDALTAMTTKPKPPQPPVEPQP